MEEATTFFVDFFVEGPFVLAPVCRLCVYDRICKDLALRSDAHADTCQVRFPRTLEDLGSIAALSHRAAGEP